MSCKRPSGAGFASATPGGALLFAAVILLFGGFGTAELRSQVITGIQDDWKSTATGPWSTAGNWSLGVAPGSTHTAVFTNLSAASSPTFAGLNISVTGIVWQSGAKAYTLTNSSGGQATITLGADGLQNYSANLQTITGSRMGLVLGSSTFFDAGSSGGLTISATGTIPFNLGAHTLTLKGSSTGIGTISSPISGSGAIVKTGSGTWTLSGTTANTYTGTTTVNDGTLQLNKTSGVNALAGTLTVGDGIGSTNSATARWLATNEIPTTTAVSINSDGLLDLNNFSNTIGTLTLMGGSITTGTGTLTLGGTVTGNASATSATISGNLGLGSANRTFTINDGAATFDLNISAVVSGTVTLTKGGTGTMVLSGANSYTGVTTVSAGTLNIQTATALGTIAGGTTVSSGAALQIQGNITVGNESLTLNGSGISGTGAFRNFSGNNTFGGPISLASATTITSDAGTLTLTGGIANGLFTSTFAGAGNISESGVINGLGGIIKTGSGTLTLTGPNSFLGGTTINGGIVAVSSDGNLGGLTSGVTLNAGTLEITAGFSTLRLFTLGNTGSTFQVNAGQTFTVNTAIIGPGTLNKTGSGTMVLSAVNLFSGGTNVSDGTLQLGAIDRLLTTAPITISGGSFDLQTFTQNAGAVTLSSGTIMGTGPGTLTASSLVLESGTANAILAGTGTVTKDTAGTVTLGGNNTFTGSTTITEGTLRLNSNNALGTTASGTTVANGAVLTLNNVNYSSAEPLTLNGSGISNGGALANSGTSTFAGPINAATNATINAGGGILNLTGGLSKNGTI